jgi:diadenylate cyclase
VLAFLIIFHPELRQGLARIGERGLIGAFITEEHIIDEIVNASFLLAKQKMGAIMAIERTNSLKPYTETGVMLDGHVSEEILESIFMPNTPLHDGGVIIHGERIVAASCLFPLSDNPRISRTLGTRHRAAIGLTEQTDAVVVVISEETGTISVAINGRLTRDLDKEGLTRVLNNLCRPPRYKKREPISIFRRKV